MKYDFQELYIICLYSSDYNNNNYAKIIPPVKIWPTIHLYTLVLAMAPVENLLKKHCTGEGSLSS